MEIKEAKTDEEILSCRLTIQGLWPHITDEEFLPRVRQLQAEGYRLMYIQDPVDNVVKSIMTFRTSTTFCTGKTMCIVDVAPLPEGNENGFQGTLLDWAKQYAKDNGFNTLSLDSVYTQLDAQRLYLKKGFHLVAHHLEMHVQD